MKDSKYTGGKDEIKDRYQDGQTNSVPGINTPEISPEIPPLPYNPPVPNRAWTAMKDKLETRDIIDEEKKMIYYGKGELD